MAGVLSACVPKFDPGAGLTVTPYGMAMRIEWPAAADPDGGSIGSYRIEVDGVEVARRSASLLHCDLAGLSAGPHQVTVTAYDDAGEWSGSATADGTLAASVTPSVVAPEGAEPGCQPVYESTLVDVGGGNTWYVDVSADGQEIAFITDSPSVPGGGGSDDNGTLDVFHRDLRTGVTTRITDGNARSDSVVMSDDGRFVLFDSGATNLVADDTNGTSDVFSWDRDSNTTTILSTGPLGGGGASVSGDGRFVGYGTRSALDPLDVNAARDAYLWDRTTGTAVLSAGASGWDSAAWDVSATARAVTYEYFDIGGRRMGYLWDRATGERVRIPESANCGWFRAADNAQAVVFQCGSGILRWDRSTGTISALTRASTGSYVPLISSEADTVVFPSQQSDLTGVPKPSGSSLALHDARTGSTLWIAGFVGGYPQMSPDASVVVVSHVSNLGVNVLRRID